MAIGVDEVNKRHLISSDPKVLQDEFNIKTIDIIKDNDLVKVSKDKITH